ncbi:MAG: hypothetical protein H8D47_04135 [Planctomycetes bacterium]|nr:hypothetical protein [Planctomycetota bacterium]MBL7107105.1 hypothetical protein [Phycisphaerae bacterium]
MFESIDKLMLAGLGALSMTKEKAEKIFDEYVKKGEVEKDKKSGFVKDLMESADKSRQELEKTVSDQVAQSFKKIKIATSEDIERIEKKIDLLLDKE